jgi:hypothetical protein
MKELGREDSQIGAVCGMTPDTVRHYTKRARALVVARSVAERLASGNIVEMGR